MLRLCHIDDPDQIRHLLSYSECLSRGDQPPKEDQRLLEMLHVTLWGDQGMAWTLEEASERLCQNPSAIADLQAILRHCLTHSPVSHAGRVPNVAGPLAIDFQYTRDEILVGLGHWSLTHRPDQREGVLHLAHSQVDAFFITLQKTEEDYSPTTMYEDYLISHELFHWQSQSRTSAESPTGQRYIRHRELGYTPLLFVRETRALQSGIASPYVFLGPCEYVSHVGSRPMSIVWKLRYAVPARLFRLMARQTVA